MADDIVMNQMVARGMLKQLGHEVTVVSNGKEAIQAVKEFPYDLIPTLDSFFAVINSRRPDEDRIHPIPPENADIESPVNISPDSRCISHGAINASIDFDSSLDDLQQLLDSHDTENQNFIKALIDHNRNNRWAQHLFRIRDLTDQFEFEKASAFLTEIRHKRIA